MTNAVSEYIKAVQHIRDTASETAIHLSRVEAAMLDLLLEKVADSLRNQWKDRDDDRDPIVFDDED